MNKDIQFDTSDRIFSFVSCPKIPEIELININKEAVVTIIFGFSAFIKKRIGLRNIPPPIPTIPEINPNTEPINKEIKKFNFLTIKLLFSQDLLFISNKKPAIERTKNKKISKISFSIFNVPPKKANGTDPIKKGSNNLKL